MENKENKKLNLISLGCAKNLVDSEILLGGLNKTNVDLTDDPEKADTIVVNTCGFLDIAREESVDTILQAAEMKKTGSLKELVVMGCLSERYPEELKKRSLRLIEYLVAMTTNRLFLFSPERTMPKTTHYFSDRS